MPSSTPTAATTNNKKQQYALLGAGVVLLLLLFLSSGSSMSYSSMEIAHSPRHHRHRALNYHEMDGFEGGAEKGMSLQQAQGARGGRMAMSDATTVKKRLQHQAPRMTTDIKANVQTPTGNWTLCRDDLINTVVPELEIVIVSQQEQEASNEPLDPTKEDYELQVERYTPSTGEYQLNVPSGKKLEVFAAMVRAGRFGKMTQPMKVTRKMIEEPMKNLEVEVKLAEDDVDRIQKLSLETAKSLDEKLRLNAMLRDAQRDLEYLRSQQRKMTTKIDYADVKIWIQEQYPSYSRPEASRFDKITIMVAITSVVVALVVALFLFVQWSTPPSTAPVGVKSL